jgi:hypothetical protein
VTDDAPKQTPDRMALPTDAGVTEPIRKKRSGTAGILTATLAIMAIGMVIAQLISALHDQPGPGTSTVCAHLAGAIAGIYCYRITTTKQGWPKRLTATALPLITAALLWFYWWS